MSVSPPASKSTTALQPLLQIVTPLKFRRACACGVCAACCHVGSLFTCCRNIKEGARVLQLGHACANTLRDNAFPSGWTGSDIFPSHRQGTCGRISAPRTAPRREQKADLKRLMLGTVTILLLSQTPNTPSSTAELLQTFGHSRTSKK